MQSIDFLKLVETDIKTITLEKSLENVIEHLSTINQQIIPVLDENSKLIGIVDFDTLRPIAFNPFRIKFTSVQEVITQPKAIINYDDGMEIIMNKFETTNETELPVIKNGKFFGLISKIAILEDKIEGLK